MIKPEDVIVKFWEHIDAEQSDMWHDLASVGWIVENIVLAVFMDGTTIPVFYRVSSGGLQGVTVPIPKTTIFNVRDPRPYIHYRLGLQERH